MSPRAQPVVIGWNEFVDLPDWGVRSLRAKVDTGARSSAVHVENLEELPRGRLRFDVVLHRKKRDRRIHVVAPISRRSRVRSSNGRTETRYFVKTRLLLGPVDKEVEISLVDRGRMIHRMLLGRTALAGPFLIDVDRRMLLEKKRPTTAKKAKKKATKKVAKKKVVKKKAVRKKAVKKKVAKKKVAKKLAKKPMKKLVKSATKKTKKPATGSARTSRSKASARGVGGGSRHRS